MEPIQTKGWMFQEIGPNQTARDLFGHQRPGDKVAIISRFPDQVKNYVEALELLGLKVRVVTGQSGEEDFCFLMNAQKEAIGSLFSTFFFWAGLLGNCTTVRCYCVDCSGHENWTNPELKRRIYFEDYILDRQ